MARRLLQSMPAALLAPGRNQSRLAIAARAPEPVSLARPNARGDGRERHANTAGDFLNWHGNQPACAGY